VFVSSVSGDENVACLREACGVVFYGWLRRVISLEVEGIVEVYLVYE